MNTDDILVWPDTTWCYGHELEEMAFMGDDYRVILFGSQEHIDFINEYEGEDDVD